MKIVEKDGEKRALIWVIRKVSNNCLDSNVILRDNKADAVKCYNKERSELLDDALYYGLEVEDSKSKREDSTHCSIKDDKGNTVKFLAINVRTVLITEKSN